MNIIIVGNDFHGNPNKKTYDEYIRCIRWYNARHLLSYSLATKLIEEATKYMEAHETTK